MTTRMDFWLSEAKGRTWRGNQHRPASVHNIIMDKPACIEIIRQNSDTQATTILAEQTVRLDSMRLPSERDTNMSELALVSVQNLILLGYKCHPLVADTDIQTGDRFAYEDRYYRVIKVESVFTDRILAYVEESD